MVTISYTDSWVAPAIAVCVAYLMQWATAPNRHASTATKEETAHYAGEAAHGLKWSADTIKTLLEEKDRLTNKLTNLEEAADNAGKYNPHLDNAINQTKNGLKNLKGRLKNIDHIPAVKAAIKHIDLMSKLATGNNAEDLELETEPEEDEIIPAPSAKPNNGKFTALPKPFFHLDPIEGEVPNPDAMDFEFTAPQAPAPNRESFIHTKEPFEFDGTKTLWNDWRAACEIYVMSNRHRFSDGLTVVNVMSNATKPGTHAKNVITAIIQSIVKDGTAERAEFESMNHSMQVFLWVMGKMAVYFANNTATADNLNILRHKQRDESFSTWIQKIDTARMALGLTYTETISYVTSGINGELAMQIANRLGKQTIELTWADLQMWGNIIETELKTAHQSRAYVHTRTTVKAAAGHTNPFRPHTVTATTTTEKRLSDDEFNKYVKEGAGCFRCFWPGHRATDDNAPCKDKPKATSLSPKQKEFLLSSAQRRKNPVTVDHARNRSAYKARAAQHFVPAGSRNPYANSMDSESSSSGADTPSSSASSASYN